MSRKKKELPDGYHQVFPTRMRLLMEEKKKTQAAVGKAIGKTRQAVGYYCDGSSSPDWETLSLLAQYFNVSADYLIGLSDTPTTDNKTAAACEVTGLSFKALDTLMELGHLYSPLISALFESQHFMDAIHKIYASLECKTSPIQRLQDSWGELTKEIVSGEHKGHVQKVLGTYAALSNDFVIVPRQAQSTSYLQESVDKFREAALETIRTVENNHSMDDTLREVAILELRTRADDPE